MTEHGARQRRLESQTWEEDTNKKGVLLWKDGEIFPGVTVSGSTISFTMNSPEQGNGLYPDDAIAVFRDLYQFYINKFGPNKYNENIVAHLQSALEEADRRAVERHGYSGSERERTYVPAYTKANNAK